MKRYIWILVSLTIKDKQKIQCSNLSINSENSELCKSLFTNYLPNSFMVTIQNSDQLKNLSEYPFFTGKSFEDKTSVFICKNFTCSLALHTLDEVNSKL